ncbi:MAG TPA: NACHT domain-containing protein [Micromonosporaceae bacterium]|nr:NACHT domain-containing protein [Micromonosporaceae bacterium]
MVTGIAALLVSAVALRLAVQQDRHTAAVDRDSGVAMLDRAADGLADAVRQQWTREAGLRQLRQPGPLRVKWSTTQRPVSAQPAAVLGQAAVGGRPTRLRLRGDLDSIVEAFRRLPARQLVVLGEPGAGKTVLAMLLTLGLLDTRARGEPVPVLLPVSSWDPSIEHLHAWLVRRLVEDYPALTNADTYGPGAAARLVRADRLMPVLDGLDEMPPALHRMAIDTIDHAVADGGPLMVTCRGSEYQAAVAAGGRFMSRAAVVEIEPVDVGDTITFLRHSRAASDTRWQPVFDHLQAYPDGPLACALSTPLMVHLVRTAYALPGTFPAELCDPSRFSHHSTIEEHLLDAYLPGVYTSYVAPRLPSEQLVSAAALYPYPSQHAQQWLAFLATHLHRLHTRDLAWWELDRAVSRLVYGLVVGVGTGLGAGLVFGLVAGLATGLVVGLSAGLVGGPVVGLRGKPPQTPTQTVTRAPGRLKKFGSYFASGLVFGVGAGLVVVLKAGLSLGLLIGMATGLISGLMVRLIGGLGEWSVTAPAHDVASRSPGSLLRSTRRGVSGQTFVAGLGAALGTGLGAGLMVRPSVGLIVGLGVGIVVGPVIGLDTIWGRFLLARVWLSLRGQLPLRLMRFLDDAHRRGVLRQAGAVYQFRHARLQDRLVTRRDQLSGRVPG